MSTTFEPVNAWLKEKLPGCEVKESASCGSSTIYLFRSEIGNIWGVYIQGSEIDEQQMHNILEAWSQKQCTPQIVLGDERCYFLAQQHLSQVSPDGKLLKGRAFHAQALEAPPSEKQVSRSAAYPHSLRFAEIATASLRAALCNNVITNEQNRLKELANVVDKDRRKTIEFKEQKEKAEKTLKEARVLHSHALEVLEIQSSLMMSGHEQCLAHLENIAWNMENAPAYAALRKVVLANEFIRNFRLLHAGLSYLPKMKEDIRSIGGLVNACTYGILQPGLACVSIYTSLLAMLNTREISRSLTQKEFYEALNDKLLPLMVEMGEVLAAGQRRLSAQMQDQTNAFLINLRVSHESLSRLIQKQGSESQKRDDETNFNQFVDQATQRAKDYNKQLADASAFIKGRKVQKNWFDEYCKLTRTVLNGAKDLPDHGFNGTVLTFPIDCIAMNPLYCTGALHQRIFGDLEFPPELPIIYSAAHTFIRLTQALLEKESLSELDHSGKSDQLLKLAEKMQAGIEKQLQLFGSLDSQLDKLIKSHDAFIAWIKKNKGLSTASKERKSDTAKEWWRNNWQRVLDNRLGKEMFRWNKFVHSPMNLKSYKDAMTTTLQRRLTVNNLSMPWLLAAPLMDFFGIDHALSLKGDPRIAAASALESKGITPNSLMRLEPGAESCIADCVKYRIWSDGREFNSSASVKADSYIPYAIFFTDGVDVGLDENPKMPPKRPLFNCIVIYDGGKFNFEFASDSRLQQKDVESIHNEPMASGRHFKVHGLIMGVDDLLRPENTQRKIAFDQFKDRFEVCLPLGKDSSLPPLPLPKTLMLSTLKRLCPEFERLSFAGSLVDLKYEFIQSADGDKYQLRLHAIDEFTQIAFSSCTICEFDEGTVKAYLKEGQEDFTEFLCCALFAFFENVGIPGNKTHYNAKEGFVAPVLTPFVGLFAVLEKFPHLCFTFNHRHYGEKVAEDLGNAIASGKLDDNLKKHFFKRSDIQVDEEHMTWQAVFSKRKMAIEESNEYKEFRDQLAIFTPLAKLVCNLNVNQIEALLATKLGILSPKEPQWIEQAYYDAPSSDGDRDEVRNVLAMVRSPAKVRLKSYQERLAKIIDFLRFAKEPNPARRTLAMSAQKVVAKELEIEGAKARADVGKDTYQRPILKNPFEQVATGGVQSKPKPAAWHKPMNPQGKAEEGAKVPQAPATQGVPEATSSDRPVISKIKMGHLPWTLTKNVKDTNVREVENAVFSEGYIYGDGDCGFSATNTSRDEVVLYLLVHDEEEIRKLVAMDVMNWFISGEGEGFKESISQELWEFRESYRSSIGDEQELKKLAQSKELFQTYIVNYLCKSGQLTLADDDEPGVMGAIAKMKGLQIRVWECVSDEMIRMRHAYGDEKDKDHTLDILHHPADNGKNNGHFNKLLLSEKDYADPIKKGGRYKKGDRVVFSPRVDDLKV